MSRSNPDWSQDAHGKAAHIEALLAERQWVQRLALSLVGDPHLADDIAQETLVAGLTRLPRHAGALRSWLAQVARNFSRRSHRDSGTRRRHEARREHARSGGEPEDFVERAEEQHRLVGAVLRLEEPFRSTVIEHYFEGRTPLAIARRSGVPAGTVRSRLKRGLDRLRAQLRPDENQPWAPAILALAAGAGVGPSAAGGTLGRWVAAAIVAFALAGGGWLIFRGDPGPAVVASSRDIESQPLAMAKREPKPKPAGVEELVPPAVLPTPRRSKAGDELQLFFSVDPPSTWPLRRHKKSSSSEFRVVSSEIWTRDCEFDGPSLGFLHASGSSGRDPLLLDSGHRLRVTGSSPEVAVLLRLELVDRESTVVFWAAQSRIRDVKGDRFTLRRKEQPRSFSLLFPGAETGERYTVHVAHAMDGRVGWPLRLLPVSQRPTPMPSETRAVSITVEDERVDVTGLPGAWAVLGRVSGEASAPAADTDTVPADRTINMKTSPKAHHLWQGLWEPHYEVRRLKKATCESPPDPPEIVIEGIPADASVLDCAAVLVYARSKVWGPIGRGWRVNGTWQWRLPCLAGVRDRSVEYELDLPGYRATPERARGRGSSPLTFQVERESGGTTVFGRVELTSGPMALPILVSVLVDHGHHVRQTVTRESGSFELTGFPRQSSKDIVAIEVDRERLRRGLFGEREDAEAAPRCTDWLRVTVKSCPRPDVRRASVDCGTWIFSARVGGFSGWRRLDAYLSGVEDAPR